MAGKPVGEREAGGEAAREAARRAAGPEAELARIARFVALCPDLYCVLGARAEVARANAAWEQATGYAPDELGVRSLSALVHAEDRPAFEELLARLVREGSSGTLEMRLTRRDGGERVLQLAAVGFPDQERVYAVARDVTELRRADRMKSEFIAVVSHELRTPLTSIVGSLGLLAGGVAGELPAAAREMLEIARKNSERLVLLINDILDVEKIESGSLGFDLKPVRVRALLEQALEASRGYGASLGVGLRLEDEAPGARVSADADRLLQVLGNLLANAAKFSPPGETVELSAQRRPGGVVRVTVSDRGCGIPEDFRPRVFQKFAQADSSDTRRKGGTGLGLSIAKAIVERHGGAIGFDSDEGEGASFWFELPEWQPPAEAAGAKAARPRVLVAAADADVERLLGAALERGGYEPVAVRGAAELRAACSPGRPAALVLDLVALDAGAVALAHELRSDERGREAPIVVVAGDVLSARLQLAGLPGIVDWVGKPLDPRRLLGALERALRPPRRERPRVLHVEDDPDVHQVVRVILRHVADVVHAVNLASARQLLLQERFDLILLDLLLPDGNGLDLLPYAHAASRVPVVVFSVRELDRQAVEGVAAALVKSRTSNQQLLEAVRSRIPREPGAPGAEASRDDGARGLQAPETEG